MSPRNKNITSVPTTRFLLVNLEGQQAAGLQLVINGSTDNGGSVTAFRVRNEKNWYAALVDLHVVIRPFGRGCESCSQQNACSVLFDMDDGIVNVQ